MSKDKDNSWSSILFWIFILSVMFVIFRLVKDRNEEIIYQNGKYAIGFVTRFSPRGKQPTGSSHIKYKYYKSNSMCEDSYSSNFHYIPSTGITKGERYMIVFHIEKPKKSFMLFKMPINSKKDYIHYLDSLGVLNDTSKYEPYYEFEK